jgi:hypothetical protein
MASSESAFSRLVKAFMRHLEVRRNGEPYEALVKSRFDLEDARSDARQHAQDHMTKRKTAEPEPPPAISRADISDEARANMRLTGLKNLKDG